MAHHNSSHYSPVETSSKVSNHSEAESFEGQTPPSFEGFIWSSTITAHELTKLRIPCHVLDSVKFLIPPENTGAVDEEGFS